MLVWIGCAASKHTNTHLPRRAATAAISLEGTCVVFVLQIVHLVEVVLVLSQSVPSFVVRANTCACALCVVCGVRCAVCSSVRACIRTRVGSQPYADSVWSAFRTIWREEGVVRGLYRGLSLNYVKTIPNVRSFVRCSLFVVYSFVRSFVRSFVPPAARAHSQMFVCEHNMYVCSMCRQFMLYSAPPC